MIPQANGLTPVRVNFNLGLTFHGVKYPSFLTVCGSVEPVHFFIYLFDT